MVGFRVSLETTEARMASATQDGHLPSRRALLSSDRYNKLYSFGSAAHICLLVKTANDKRKCWKKGKEKEKKHQKRKSHTTVYITQHNHIAYFPQLFPGSILLPPVNGVDSPGVEGESCRIWSVTGYDWKPQTPARTEPRGETGISPRHFSPRTFPPHIWTAWTFGVTGHFPPNICSLTNQYSGHIPPDYSQGLELLLKVTFGFF